MNDEEAQRFRREIKLIFGGDYDWLTQREKDLIIFRFDLEGGGCHTLKQTGERFGIGKERVRQIEAKILRKLRRKYGLSFFWPKGRADEQQWNLPRYDETHA